ncbi:MAG: right-handed parallel beta-helix repeat-containing protein [Actinomycetota bacterium]
MNALPNLRNHLGRAAVAATLAVGGLAVLTASPAAALTGHTVTTTADVVDGADGVLSLREAIDLANGDGDDSVINLTPGEIYELDLCVLKEPWDTGSGYFVPPDDDDANADGDLDHTAGHDLTIVGAGATIRQTCAYDRVIESHDPATNLTIDGITVRDGMDAPDEGDNIRSAGSLTLQDATVTGSRDFSGGGYSVKVGDSNNYDPTIFLTMVNSSISANDEHGARLDYGVLTATNSTVTGNDGHGLLVSFGSTQITGSTITENNGTGVSGIDSGHTIQGSTIAGNVNGVSATGNTPGMSPISLTGTTVDGNERGGVSCSYCETVTITGSTISNNGQIGASPGAFGGISVFTYRANPGVTITDSALFGNRSIGDGGAIVAQFPDDGFAEPGHIPTVSISNTDLYDNRSGILSKGGAIYVEDAAVEILDGSSLNGNQSKPDDVLAGGDGGAVWVGDGGSLRIVDSFLTGNLADGDGGAIRAFGLDGVEIDRSLIADNQADGGSGGGANLFQIEAITVRDSDILDNTSRIGGGGLKLGAYDVTPYLVLFDGSTVARNRTTSSSIGGGGIFANGDLLALTMINSTVSDNVAPGPGAGLEILGDGNLELRHVTMVANESTGKQEANLFHQNGDLLSFATVIGAGIGGDDCGTFSGNVISAGYNRSGDSSCGFGHWTDDQNVVALGLDGLADNGGPTQTRLPNGTSPLVNVIPVADCVITVDQRNQARPDGANCDVGAVEVDGVGSGADDFKPVDPDRPGKPIRPIDPEFPDIEPTKPELPVIGPEPPVIRPVVPVRPIPGWPITG